MDIFTFLAIVLIVAAFSGTIYFMDKRNKEFFDKLMQKFEEKTVVTMPWQETIDNPDAQVKTDDQIPLEELEEDEFKKDVAHMFTTRVQDKEEEQAREEIN